MTSASERKHDPEADALAGGSQSVPGVSGIDLRAPDGKSKLSDNLPQQPALFPLPLSDFEFYMFTDDRPSHPMVFVMTAVVNGSLQKTPVRESLAEIIAAHPLLGCRIEKLAGHGWCWVPVADATLSERCMRWVETGEQTVRTHLPSNRSLNIRDDVGFFLDILVSPECAQIVLYLHHCCCDGIGGIQLIGELLARYGQRTAEPGAKKPAFDVLDPEQLRIRENYDTGEAAAQRQKKSLGQIPGKICRLMLRVPVILAGSSDSLRPASTEVQSATNAPNNLPADTAIQSRCLPRSTYRVLRAVATKRGASINDLLLAEMILHVRDWNQHRGVSMKKRWIRLAVPLSMRTSRHTAMPATNIVSYALVTRREQDWADEQALLQSIHQQTHDVLFNREGIVCLKIFRVLRKIPGAMKAFLGSKSVFSTMVLANVGDIRKRFHGSFPLQKGCWIAGNVVVEAIHGVAPVRPNTRVAMSIGDYAGELSMNLRTDVTAVSAEDGCRFLDEYLHRLTQLVKSEGTHETDAATEEAGY